MKGRIMNAVGVTNIILGVSVAGVDRSMWLVALTLWATGTAALVAEGADL